jgi:hypothetical protein
MEVDPEFRFLIESPDCEEFTPERHELAKNGTGVEDFNWDSPLTSSTAPPENGEEVHFEKRSSGPYRIRLEKSVVDGEVWVFGYDHLGRCVRSGPTLAKD